MEPSWLLTTRAISARRSPARCCQSSSSSQCSSRETKEEPEVVLGAIRALPTPTPEAATVKRTALRYLKQRQEQIRSAHFQEQGYPIGSGMVESAGTLVVEARMKGSGMTPGGYPAPNSVNPLLALRGRLCSGQWEQTWKGIRQAWRVQVVQRRDERRQVRQAKRAAAAALRPAPPPAAPPKRTRAKTIVDGRPTEAHPWKGRRTEAAA